jgi:hypothetical protein
MPMAWGRGVYDPTTITDASTTEGGGGLADRKARSDWHATRVGIGDSTMDTSYAKEELNKAT